MSLKSIKSLDYAISEWKAGNCRPLEKIKISVTDLFLQPDIILDLLDITVKFKNNKLSRQQKNALKAISDLLKTFFNADKEIMPDLKEEELSNYIKFTLLDSFKIIEDQAVDANLLSYRREFQPDKGNCNSECMIGIFQFLEKYKFFRIPDPIRKGKKLSKIRKCEYFNRRWNAHLTKEIYRSDPRYLEIARARIPFIDEYIKNEELKLKHK